MNHLKKFEKFNIKISEGLQYHIENNLKLTESVYRIESQAWLDLVNESRSLYKSNEIKFEDDDIWLLESLVGEKGIFEGEEVLLDIPFEIIESTNEAEYHGKKVNLNKPFRTSGGPKKFAVYTKNDKGNVVKVGFGDPKLSVKNRDPKKAKSFRARHHCESPGPKWKAKYWSCNVGRYAKLLGLKSNRPW